MATPKKKTSTSRRNMRRSHDALIANTVSVDKTTGESHLRHHVTKDGFYRGRQLFATPATEE